MAAEVVTGDKRALAALLFLAASNETMQAYGTLNSSPWTAESFGADDRRAKALKEYIVHAVVYSTIYAAASAAIAGGMLGVWIMAGSVVTNVYLVWLYMRASMRGRQAGSTEWANAS
jgi:hypothetical protein